MAQTMWYRGPLLALDLETTDRDPHEDRIVTARIVQSLRSRGSRVTVSDRKWLADPGVEIPPDATDIHGVTTEEPRQHGRPAAEVVAEIESHLAMHWTPTVPLCIFNVTFDLTMIDAELWRAITAAVSLSADRSWTPNALTATWSKINAPVGIWPRYAAITDYEVELKRTPEGKHDAKEDALAAARLVWPMGARYPEIGQLTLTELQRRQAQWYREQEQAFAERIDWRANRIAGRDPAEAQALRDWAGRVRAAVGSWPIQAAELNPRAPKRKKSSDKREKPQAAPTPKRDGPPMSLIAWTQELHDRVRHDWLGSAPRLTPNRCGPRSGKATGVRRVPFNPGLRSLDAIPGGQGTNAPTMKR
jgi:DNA polymerase-3 subunit epsilon